MVPYDGLREAGLAGWPRGASADRVPPLSDSPPDGSPNAASEPIAAVAFMTVVPPV